MTKSFQKPANNLQELNLPHPGIINSDDFNRHFDLHCYKPSPDLQPFIVHIWTQRRKQPITPLLKIPIEIMTGPNVYLFFTPDSTFIHDVTKHIFTYNPLLSDNIAGVKFQPGGFYPFLRHVASTINSTPTATSIFPQIDATFTKRLLAESDSTIVSSIEALLRTRNPKTNKKMQLVSKIANALATDTSLRTVSATAQAFNMSERSLQLLFQTHIGIGVKRMIARRRLLEAITRAQHQSHPAWAEIAAELGYSSQSHFSRDFKNNIGLSPSEYSKSLLFE